MNSISQDVTIRSRPLDGPCPDIAAPLEPGMCRLWWARADDAHPRLRALLDDDERQRLAWLRQPADRDRFLVAVAVACGRPVGVDVEQLRSDVPVEELAPRVLTVEEAQQLDSLNGPERVAGFLLAVVGGCRLLAECDGSALLRRAADRDPQPG